MRREVPIWLVVLAIGIVLVVIAVAYYRATKTPPPQEVHPVTGEPIGKAGKAPTPVPEHLAP